MGPPEAGPEGWVADPSASARLVSFLLRVRSSVVVRAGAASRPDSPATVAGRGGWAARLLETTGVAVVYVPERNYRLPYMAAAGEALELVTDAVSSVPADTVAAEASREGGVEAGSAPTETFLELAKELLGGQTSTATSATSWRGGCRFLTELAWLRRPRGPVASVSPGAVPERALEATDQNQPPTSPLDGRFLGLAANSGTAPGAAG